MASVKTARKGRKTAARTKLDFALGKVTVSLSDLSDPEFEDLLDSTLDDVDLRELRGFTTLKDVLTIRPGSHTYGRQPTYGFDLEILSVGEDISFMVNGFEENIIIDWQTHILKMCRGWTKRETLYKRHETDEETDDYSVASSWGNSGYLFRGEGEILAIRRPRNHAPGGQCLLKIYFWFEKVQLKHEFIVVAVEVEKLTPGVFRQYFGDQSAHVAAELIWELRDAYRRTADTLKSQADHIQGKSVTLDQLSKAVAYR